MKLLQIGSHRVVDNIDFGAMIGAAEDIESHHTAPIQLGFFRKMEAPYETHSSSDLLSAAAGAFKPGPGRRRNTPWNSDSDG